MKVKDLLGALQRLSPEDQDLDVYVEADGWYKETHRTLFLAQTCGVQFCSEPGGMGPVLVDKFGGWAAYPEADRVVLLTTKVAEGY